MRFEIGQRVWMATWDSVEDYVTCPDCGGTGRIRVILHDQEMVSIECAGCSAGYEPPKGYIRCYKRQAKVEQVTITGVEMRDGKAGWRSDRCYIMDESDVHETEASALERAAEKAKDADREEREKIAAKEKPTRTWAWNAHYHRKEIKRAQQQIEYHTKKLAAANLKAREDKIALTQGE